jgi:hypothetical protein
LSKLDMQPSSVLYSWSGVHTAVRRLHYT